MINDIVGASVPRRYPADSRRLEGLGLCVRLYGGHVVCCVLCAVCCVLCAVCCVLCAVCCVLCAVCCVLCAV